MTTTTKKVASYYLPLAAVLITAAAVVAVPFQQVAYAQEPTTFLVRVVQGASQAGLVNLNVQVGNVVVADVLDVRIERNQVQVPIVVQDAIDVNAGVQVCAEILDADGGQVCRFVQNVKQGETNRATLNLNQAQQ